MIKSIQFCRCVLLTTVLPVAVLGQPGTGATLTSGNSIWVQGDSPLTPVVSGANVPLVDYITTVPIMTPDNAFQSWWFYRYSGSAVDTREYNFNNAYNTVIGPSTLRNEFLLDTPAVPPAVAPRATLDISLVSVGPNAAAITQTLDICNTQPGATDALISVFHYMDFDPNGSFSHPYSYAPNGIHHNFTMSSGPVTIDWTGFLASRFQAGPFSAIRASLTNGTITTANNSVSGTPGDFTGMFQWDVNVSPGTCVPIVSGAGLNTAPMPEPGSLGLLALGGIALSYRRRGRHSMFKPSR